MVLPPIPEHRLASSALSDRNQMLSSQPMISYYILYAQHLSIPSPARSLRTDAVGPRQRLCGAFGRAAASRFYRAYPKRAHRYARDGERFRRVPVGRSDGGNLGGTSLRFDYQLAARG